MATAYENQFLQTMATAYENLVKNLKLAIRQMERTKTRESNINEDELCDLVTCLSDHVVELLS